MVLATADSTAAPSARVVLLKGADAAGLVFFTDARSQKGQELGTNPRAALVFWWGELERQVRISGSVSPVTEAESDAYFMSRPEDSRLSAWASRQSCTVKDRAELEAAWQAAAARHPHGQIPRPDYWGGFRVTTWNTNSGKAAPAACTTGCVTGKTPPAPGSLSGPARSRVLLRYRRLSSRAAWN